jgi:hypothetical protein
MRKLILILLITCSIYTKANDDRYLFTNVSKSISDIRKATKQKAEYITWLFSCDSSIINVIAETENVQLSIYEKKLITDSYNRTISDAYLTDVGNVFVEFRLLNGGNKGDFLRVVWTIGENEFIYKMK